MPCKGMAVDVGIAGDEPGSRSAYVVAGYLFFSSVEAFTAAFGLLAQEMKFRI